MKKLIFTILATAFFSLAFSQISRPTAIVKRKPDTLRIVPAPAPVSVYSLASVKVAVRTGSDNKESPSKFIVYVMENKGIWGEGKELFTQQNQNASVSELKINSETSLSMQKSGNQSADAYTLTTLQAKGLKFIIWYWPNFFADAWKIERVTLTLEFKDQYGNLHPNYGAWTVQYNISNGLLTKNKPVMTGTTDNMFTPLPVTITEKFW
jgi:hypothetical protein